MITGFEPLDILEGIRRTIVQLEGGQSEVENAYERAVTMRATLSLNRRWPTSSRSRTVPGEASE